MGPTIIFSAEDSRRKSVQPRRFLPFAATILTHAFLVSSAFILSMPTHQAQRALVVNRGQSTKERRKMSDEDEQPRKHFVHTHAAHFMNKFFFYAYGNTPPMDILQHIPHDSPRAKVLSIGCGDIRDVLYSILLHGRRGISGGSTPRPLSFTLNDWEPAIHARNIMLLQLILDCRTLLDENSTEGITEGLAAANINDGSERLVDTTSVSGQHMEADASSRSNTSVRDAAFSQRIGEIFSAMYNVFIDKGVVKIIRDSARILTAHAASQSEWSSTEIGRYITFSDDRSRERIRAIFLRYADGSLLGKRSAMRVRREWAALHNEMVGQKIKKNSLFLSRCWGLASFCHESFDVIYSKMKEQYLMHGVLDPFPLLKGNSTSQKGRGSIDLVNPLLLVTERKGTTYCLHYGAFPLDAFHTDALLLYTYKHLLTGLSASDDKQTTFTRTEVSFWKLRDEGAQEEYGKLAPRVIKEHNFQLAGFELGSRVSSEDESKVQGAWFIAALEELAQMCGSFLKFTSTRGAHLDIVINAADALNFCDALSAASSSLPDERLGTSSSNAREGRTTFEPISFQQGTLQPLKLLYDVFGTEDALEYDVITTSNLAEHLGVVNILVATSPLLKQAPHAVILTNYLAVTQSLPMYQSVMEFYDQLLCMSPHTAAVLLGVVAVPHLSTVVDHADVGNTLDQLVQMFCQSNTPNMGPARSLRLAWKRPTRAFSGTLPSLGDMDIRASITPEDFAKLTLPVYKAMHAHMPKGVMSPWIDGPSTVRAMVIPKFYTSASFARLVAVASRHLHLETAHYKAALDAVIADSGLLLAPNLQQEKAGLFRALDLSCIRHFLGGVPGPVDTRRVVLLVPKSGLSLLREFAVPEVFLSLTGTRLPFDNHFATIHMTYVRVHRKRDTPNPAGDGWQSLSNHLSVRDTSGDDPDAELMVSAVVPTFALTLAPLSQTELQLLPQDIPFLNLNTSKRVMEKLGGLRKVFYRARLDDLNRTAILIPENESVGTIPKLIVCPSKGLKDEGQLRMPASTANRFQGLHGEYAMDYSLELVFEGRRFVYRVTMTMANDEARGLLASIGIHPVVERGHDLCCAHIQLGGDDVTIVSRFPFPLEWKALRLKFSKKRGFLQFTVPPLAGLLEKPFSLTGHSTGGGRSGTVLFSNWCFPASVPLATLPKLDFNAEWARNIAMGALSSTPSEMIARQGGQLHGTQPHRGLLQLKESLLAIVSSVCEMHKDNLPFWKHPWICLTTRPGNCDRPCIWLWVNDILLDSSNEALVVDCCILLVSSWVNPASIRLGAALEYCCALGSSPINFIEVESSELELWTALLPTAVERARQSYAHSSDCRYSRPNGVGGTSICGCGRGNDLPPDFANCMRSVEAKMDGNIEILPLFYRAAFSPLYALSEMKPTVQMARPSVDSLIGPARCANCGSVGPTKRCSRCQSANYCSKNCQRQHWKSHKAVCNEIK